MCNGATAPPLRPQAPSISALADQNRLAKRRAQRLSASPMGILGKIFIWWDGATIGTPLHHSRKGTKVGAGHQGLAYYQGGTPHTPPPPRRHPVAPHPPLPPPPTPPTQPT